MASSYACRLVCLALVLCVLLPVLSAAQYAFRDEPQDRAVQRGDTAVLRCSVDHYSNTTTIGWFNRDLGKFISRNRVLKRPNLNRDQLERYSIIGDPSRGEFNLQILNFTDSDAATYACQIFAASSMESIAKYSQNAELTVAPYNPRCYVDSKSLTPMVGEMVNLVCESRNPGFSGELKWMYAAREWLMGNVTQSPFVRKVVTRVLTPLDYNARFMCFEETRACILIPLRQFIPVLVQTADAQPEIGDSLTYRCVANKDLTPLSYSWHINGEDIGITEEELTIGPVNASHNGSIIECAVKHDTGFKGNDSITLLIQPAEGEIRTSTQETIGQSTKKVAPMNTHVSPAFEYSTPLPNSNLLDKDDSAKKNLGDGDEDELLTPFVISASVVGILLMTVIVLLTVFLSRQRATNRIVADVAKSKDGEQGPNSDCVPLDLVSSRDGNINNSPSISVGTLKGFRNPAGCGSVDTFELDLDPDSQPEYYTLEHNYYEATVRNQDLKSSICSDKRDSSLDGIEVSETITPNSELTARNRKFSFGSSPPPPVPTSPVHTNVSMVVPPEFEGNDAEAECLVAAYAVTDVARSSPPDARCVIPRGGSLKRPLPARPHESSGYRTPSVVFANERPFRRFGSLKSLGEPAVGAIARSNSLKRPLPATPRDGAPRTPCTPDPYRNPTSLFSRIPPFLTSETTPPSTNPPVIATPEVPEPKADRPSDPSEALQKLKVPQKYQQMAVPLERLSAVTSASEGDYAEIDSDQEASETDSLMSNSSTIDNISAGPGENDTQSTVDIEDVPGRASNEDEGVFENEYDMVPDTDGEETDTVRQTSSPALNSESGQVQPEDSNKVSQTQGEISPDGTHELSDTIKSPLYAKVKKPKTEELQPEYEKNQENDVEIGVRFCGRNISPTQECLRTDTADICQKRALLHSAEPPYALVK